jgi:hypothetical protein
MHCSYRRGVSLKVGKVYSGAQDGRETRTNSERMRQFWSVASAANDIIYVSFT